MDEPKHILCYACQVDWDYHLGNDADGMDIYFDLEGLERHRKCITGCGVVSFTIDRSTAKVIQEGDWDMVKSTSKTMEECLQQEYQDAYTSYKMALKRLKKLREYRRKRLSEKSNNPK